MLRNGVVLEVRCDGKPRQNSIRPWPDPMSPCPRVARNARLVVLRSVTIAQQAVGDQLPAAMWPKHRLYEQAEAPRWRCSQKSPADEPFRISRRLCVCVSYALITCRSLPGCSLTEALNFSVISRDDGSRSPRSSLGEACICGFTSFSTFCSWLCASFFVGQLCTSPFSTTRCTSLWGWLLGIMYGPCCFLYWC